MYDFHFRFHWSLFLGFEFTIFQHWFRYWPIENNNAFKCHEHDKGYKKSNMTCAILPWAAVIVAVKLTSPILPRVVDTHKKTKITVYGVTSQEFAAYFFTDTIGDSEFTQNTYYHISMRTMCLPKTLLVCNLKWGLINHKCQVRNTKL